MGLCDAHAGGAWNDDSAFARTLRHLDGMASDVRPSIHTPLLSLAPAACMSFFLRFYRLHAFSAHI